MPSKAFKLAEAMVSNPVMSDMVENPTATPTQIAAVETKTSAISDTGVISVNTKNIISNNVLTQSFDSNQVVGFNLTDSINTVSPIVSVFKEIPVSGVSSKGQWDVNANATNYDFYDEKPISYASSTLTPSATGDGTFTMSPASTTTYTLENSSYSTGFSVTSQTSNPRDVAFKGDGTKMYVLSGTKYIYEYTLSTAYDVSTASYVGSINLGPLESAIFDTYGLRFKPDGTKVYVVDYYGKVWQFSLSTAWSISTTTYDNVNITGVVGSDGPPYAFTFKPDGTKLFAVADRRLYEWVLSTAWDLSSASISNQASGKNADYLQFTTYTNTNSHYAFDFAADGTKFVIQAVGSNGSSVGTGLFEVPISSAWDPLNSTSNSLSSDGTLGTDVVRYTGFFDATGGNTVTGFQFINSGNSAAVVVSHNSTGTVYILDTTATQPPFSSTDIGKKVVGNSGSAVITSAAGAYTSVTAFADTSAISSWQLFGAQGKSDGSGITLAGFSSDFDISSAGSELYNWVDAYLIGQRIKFSNDGSRFFLAGNNGIGNGQVYRWDLNTAYDLNSIVTNGGANTTGSFSYYASDVTFNSDGSLMYVLSGGNVYKYTATNNAFTGSGLSVSLSNTTNLSSIGVDNYSLEFSSDGTKLYIGQFLSNFGGVRQLNLTTAWDPAAGFTDAYAYTITEDTIGANKALPWTIRFIDNGSKMLVLGGRNDEIYQYTLSTAWDLSTASYSNKKYSNSSIADFQSFDLSADTSMMFTFERNNNQNYYRSFNISDTTNIVLPYSQYSPALTNSINGQINSSAWQDINSMTADETKNDGDVFYAVSTDNRTSWGVAKGSDGVRKIAKNNSGTWQYNNNAGTSTIVGYDLSSSASLSKTLSYNSQDASGTAMAFNNDGTKLYFTGEQNNIIHEYALSTAYDISTSSYNSVTFNPSVLTPIDIKWKPDGTKLYILDYDSSVRGTIYTFNVSTAWDITTASSASETFRGNAQDSSFIKFAFKTDGTMLFKLGRQGNRVHAYNLSTAWDVSTASYASAELPMGNVVSGSTTGTHMNGLAFNSSGTKVFVAVYHASTASSNRIYEIDLSTAWDIGIDNNDNGNYAGVYLQTPSVINVLFNGDGSQVYTMNNSTDTILSYSSGSATIIYSTSETWVNGTNNNEHATLQQALTSQAFNRMNKAQLDAVADGYHFSQDSADTLDLMIAPYAASGTSPISDGVTINYDAAALVREAIPGTDYIAEFPNNTTINIKSLVNANMKVRAL